MYVHDSIIDVSRSSASNPRAVLLQYLYVIY
jgi:hypothetical protein